MLLNLKPTEETPAPNADGKAEEPKNIEVDTHTILLPDVSIEDRKKPQLILKREGEAANSESYHTELVMNDPCKLRQGYVLLQ